MTISHNPTRTQIDAVAVQQIIDATTALRLARQGLSHELVEAAQSDLRIAVRRANEQGLSRQVIGDALGIARGNAYQRYRRRPETPTTTASHVPPLTPPGP